MHNTYCDTYQLLHHKTAQTHTLTQQIISLVYCDINGQIAIVPKVLGHCGLKYQTVIAGYDAGYSIVDASRLCLPGQLAASSNELELVPGREETEMGGVINRNTLISDYTVDSG